MKKALNDLKNVKKLTNKDTQNLKGGGTNTIHCEWYVNRTNGNGQPMGTLDSNGKFKGITKLSS